MKHSQYLTLKLLFATLLLSACNNQPKLNTIADPVVTMMTINEVAPSPRMQFPAVAAAADRSELAFRVSGEITQINVKPGDMVKKDQVLASLDTTDYQLSLDDAKTRYKLAQSQFSRAAKLVKTGSLAKSQYDELKAQRDIAKADHDLAALKLSYTKLLAPFDGVVSRVPALAFEVVGVGQSIMNIHNISDVDIKIQAADIIYVNHSNRESEETLAEVDPRVVLDDGKEYRLTMKEFTVEPDPVSGAFMVTLTMPMPKDRIILDGMSVDVNASGEGLLAYNAGAMEIPIEAVFNADGDSLDASEQYVWLLDDENRVHKQKIEVEKLTPTGIRVTNGIAKGERLVTSGVNKLVDGQLVIIKGEENRS
ncbi:efflux RND transporter periplasmic adaptor subunit [Shewanella woodyi]|uniref:Efflux transporter, RND family, MFP subunit n=1 Tax=Shewanella woodyi (strain ATCC 51908 / MS32) TaxID=392500 RepID=B1KHS2_SHEWM|nr:efflux RND transporter periplasmic adaptor subunit [Shewanella woodyi]ACA88400.1 efflux transporter, RND family, MFP subunit [Shewanella woodyi ATCC 51908]